MHDATRSLTLIARLPRRYGQRRLVLIAATLVAAAFAPMAAAEVPAARAALAAGDCKSVGEAINEGLGRNEAEAFFIAGALYDVGTCVEADPARAARLYRRAIDLGDGDAAPSLAMLYGSGRGVPQDYAMAHLVFHDDKPAAGDAGASKAELAALGYAETLARLAVRDVVYPVTANSKGIEGNMDVVVTPGGDRIDFTAVHIGVEAGSNLARTHDFTDQIDTAYRSAMARVPRPEPAADSPIKVATP